MVAALERLRLAVLGQPETGLFGLSLPCPQCGATVTVPVTSRWFPRRTPAWWRHYVVRVSRRRDPHPTAEDIVASCRACIPDP